MAIIRIYKKPNEMYNVFEYSPLLNKENWLFSRMHPDNVFTELSRLNKEIELEFIDMEFGEN